MIRRGWAVAVIGLLPALAAAYEAPLAYARSTVRITLSQPAEGNKDAAPLFDAEIRNAESAAAAPGWHNFARLKERKAALLAYATPTPAVLNASNDYAPTDVLMVDAYGVIKEIFPALIPARIAEPVRSSQPVLAVLYLKSGAAAELGIRPGDIVQHAMFRKKIPVIAATEQSADSSPIAEEAAPVAAPVLPVLLEAPSGSKKPALRNTGPLMVTPPEKPVAPPENTPTPPAPPEPETLLERMFR